jgi:hypothetical protein
MDKPEDLHKKMDKPPWTSKTVFLGTIISFQWLYIVYLFVENGVGAQAGKGLSIPRELWWCLILKGFLDTLIVGGRAALDYYLKLPFAQAFGGLPSGEKKTAKKTPPPTGEKVSESTPAVDPDPTEEVEATDDDPAWLR